jgi:hypothetical protein
MGVLGLNRRLYQIKHFLTSPMDWTSVARQIIVKTGIGVRKCQAATPLTALFAGRLRISVTMKLGMRARAIQRRKLRVQIQQHHSDWTTVNAYYSAKMVGGLIGILRITERLMP